MKGSFTSMSCRSIRFGSYKTIPKERTLFAPQGIRISFPFTEGTCYLIICDIFSKLI